MASKGPVSRLWKAWESRVDMPRATAAVIAAMLMIAAAYGALQAAGVLSPREALDYPHFENESSETNAFSPYEDRFVLTIIGISRPVLGWGDVSMNVMLAGPDYIGERWFYGPDGGHKGLGAGGMIYMTIPGEASTGFRFPPLDFRPAGRGLEAAVHWEVPTADGNATVLIAVEDLDGDRRITSGDKVTIGFPFPLARGFDGGNEWPYFLLAICPLVSDNPFSTYIRATGDLWEYIYMGGIENLE